MTKTICLFFILLASCQPMYGYDYAIEIKNEGNDTLYSVLVESTGGLQFSFGTTIPDSGSYYAGEKSFPFRDKFTLSWSNLERDMFNDFGEKPFTEVIDTSSVPKDFKGVLQFKIDAQNKVSYKAIPYSEYYGEEK